MSKVPWKLENIWTETIKIQQVARAVLREKYISLSAYIGKTKRFKIGHFKGGNDVLYFKPETAMLRMALDD